MAGLTITITDAGRAELINAPNTGTNAVTIAQIGVSSVHTPGSLKALTSLPGEVKRVTTFGGDVVAADVFHVTVTDESADVYTVRSFGLYLSTGTLFAVCSSADVIVEKSAGALVLLSADIALKTLDTASIEFGGTGFINPPATIDRQGVVELATQQETAAGADATRAVTPLGLLFTLQSWATNFAAAVHRHAMTSIDGLPEALAGKSGTNHTHDAGATISGVFNVGRIPALAMDKITGLAAALALKASLNSDVVFKDISADRGDGSGAIFFGRVDRYIQSTGSAYFLPNAPLDVNGGRVWTALTFNPADKAAAIHSHDWAQVTGKPAWVDPGADTVVTGYKQFTASPSSIANGTGGGGRGALEVTGSGGGAAYQAFHRPGSHAAYFGLDTDNQWKVGGWSMGPVAYRIWHEGNFDPNTKANKSGDVFSGPVEIRWPGGSQIRLTREGGTGYGLIQHVDWNDFYLLVTNLNDAQGGFNNLRPLRISLATGDVHVEHGLYVSGGRVLTEANLDVWWPAGELKLFDAPNPPGGGSRLLVANGATVSRSTYDRLFAQIGTRYGVGDGASTFQLPDWRGVFFRGLDNGRGLDPSRSLGVFQGSQNLAHSHGLPVRDNADSGFNIEDAGTGGAQRAVNTSTEGGAEARPVNQALLACITY
ncbi:MAG: tail fiber protein [Brevundimonas sp.]|uniref:tail fiber protein n=1 Tax=Brevundimonas sp. TaxID=1871086 RepID=UPI002719CF39|nr:tail fiber protein [Brevundimonas sp.]MDO9607217.1 tail fiber protein [Brevundimonas sp.]